MAGTTVEDAGRNGVICLVRLHDPVWAEVVRDEWQSFVRKGEAYGEGDDRWSRGRARWMCWMPTEAPRPACKQECNEQFALAVSEGKHCVGIAANLEWLPTDLVVAADVRLELPTLRGADVAELVRELCGDPSRARLSDACAALLTPRLVRLARRPGQAADCYVGKLASVLRREHVAAKADPARVQVIGPTLDDLPGMDAAVAWGRDLARDLTGYRNGTLAWTDVDRGALLYGPPGTGKTTYARALAATCGVPLTLGSLGQWQAAGHLGDLLKAMRGSFAAALKATPAIMFVDEVDGFGDRASFSADHRDYCTQVVNAFLELLDGASAREGLVVVAACNNPKRLDPAITRSGRLDRSIEIPLPGVDALQRILRFHLRDDLEGADLSAVAMSALGLTGADCERLVRGARRRARGSGRAMLPVDLIAEIAPSPRSPADDLRIAYHEAGHALMTMLTQAGEIVCATIRAAADMEGGVMSALERRHANTASDLDVRLQVLLAGRAAEEVALGQASTGAGGSRGSDLARATALATAMEVAYGLGSGLLWTAPSDVDPASVLAFRPDVARRVSERLDGAYETVAAMLRRERLALDALAAALVERGMLSGDELRAIVEVNR